MLFSIILCRVRESMYKFIHVLFKSSNAYRWRVVQLLMIYMQLADVAAGFCSKAYFDENSNRIESTTWHVWINFFLFIILNFAIQKLLIIFSPKWIMTLGSILEGFPNMQLLTHLRFCHTRMLSVWLAIAQTCLLSL